jgi:site-specific DNA recombinase
MAKIRQIKPAMPKLPTRKRVAAYARVSMETERLHHSLSAQVSYYSSLIQSNPEWIYAGVYADEGISGTSTEKRAEFQRMLADCEAGHIDIILTKSISRFARNTVDLLNTVRHLRELGIEVRFEKENINSLSGDGEVMLTLLASFAQSESESISNNVKWGVRKRMQQGIPNGHFRIYGYRWEGDDLVIVPEEAAIVKRIFQNFLDGKSRLETEREFAAEGITTREGCRWVDSNIKQVLTNVTYTGNLLLQKEFIEDPIGKKRRKNHGQLPQYYVENTHESIIDKETFDYVQAEIARRKELGPFANKSLDTCCFTGKIKCPHCGLSYMHERRTDRGTYQEFWTCGSRKLLASKKAGRPKCPNKGSINHKNLIKACNEVLGLTEFDEQVFLDKVDHIEVPEGYVLDFFMKDGTVIRKPCPNTGHQECWTAEYRAKTSAKRRKNPTCRKATVFTAKLKCAECGNNYRRQTRKHTTGEKYYIYACATTNTCHNNCIHEDTLKAICAKVLGLSEFDEAAFTENIEKITVSPGGHLTFAFKDGHEVQEDYDISRRMPKWSSERRARYEAAPKQEYSTERRRRMSERMKQIRSEKYWNSKGR